MQSLQQQTPSMSSVSAIQAARSPATGLRPVVVSARVREGVAYVNKEIARGQFHGWGKEFEEFSEGACEYSVAIVELENGDVETYSANQIRFLDRDGNAS